MRHPVITNLGVGRYLTNHETTGACGTGKVLIFPKGAHTPEYGFLDGLGKFGLDRIEVSIIHKEHRVEHTVVDGEVDMMRAGRDFNLALVPPDVTSTAGAASASTDFFFVHFDGDLAVSAVLSHPDLPNAVDRKVCNPR